MSSYKLELDFSDIPSAVQAPLTAFASILDTALGENLRALTVVGSALGPDYRPGVSDINSVLLLDRLDQPALKALAGQAKAMHRQRVAPPLLMTAQYITRSRDVFGVELLDFQLMGKTVRGDNPFTDLSFSPADVRLQCERELKAMLIRLRQGYLAAAGNSRLLRELLIATAKSSLPYLRAMLWLKRQERPPLVEQTFTQASTQFGVGLTPLLETYRWREAKTRLRDIELENAFVQSYETVERLSEAIDALEVGA